MNLNSMTSFPLENNPTMASTQRERNRPAVSAGITGQSSTEATGESPSAEGQSRDPLSDKTVFLQLLVSQIKYQNPLEPADSIQYVTQLNQFSATEQLVEIRKLLEPVEQAKENSAGNRT
jgi:flagellar basal-body rod modification protein FlgD